ncbi:hypothetical protein B4U79_04232, partial [Dinothrombium tinctorium]
GRKFLPKLWVLMTHKNMESYERLFEEIRDYAEELEVLLNVQVIITDFEQAVIRVIREQFPQARHKGCNFHLGQIIWRRIQGEGLAKFYGENEEGSLLLRHLGALAFLKDEEIEEAYNGLESRFRSEFGGVLVKLWEWFGENYVKGRVRSRSGNISPPLFPPSFWSIYDCLDHQLPRTQNALEGWHRRWNELLGVSHVGVIRFVKALREEQKYCSRVSRDCENGEILA